jgi:hypothetical protein
LHDGHFGADAIIGRGTRVFKVYNKMDVNKTPRVLKDAWVEGDRSREGDILAALFAKIKSEGREEKLRDAQRYFLTSSTRRCQNRRRAGPYKNSHHALLTIGNLTRRKSRHRSEHSHRSNIGNVPIFEDPLKRTARARSASIPVRVHHRIVFEEVGVAIHNLTSLRDVYQSLNDALKGKPSAPFLRLLGLWLMLYFGTLRPPNYAPIPLRPSRYQYGQHIAL